MLRPKTPAPMMRIEEGGEKNCEDCEEGMGGEEEETDAEAEAEEDQDAAIWETERLRGFRN